VKTRGVAARAESGPSGQNLLDGPAEVHFQSFVCRPKVSFANNCLLARRLAERGVRFIQLYHRD